VWTKNISGKDTLMAMEGTHVRFARELLEVADVTDIQAYYSGAVYPDSRYITGVAREVVHPRGVSLPEDFEGKSDFEKGWLTHAYYDEHAGGRLKEMFGIEKIGQGDDAWVKVTAAKMIEELASLKVLGDNVKVFSALSFAESPNGEKRELLKKYYKIQNGYCANGSGRVENFTDIYRAFVSEGMWGDLIKTTESLSADNEIVKKIEAIYPAVVSKII